MWPGYVTKLTINDSTVNIAVEAKNVGHAGHIWWLGPNVWWEISQIHIEYVKAIRQMSDEPWKFFAYTDIAQG